MSAEDLLPSAVFLCAAFIRLPFRLTELRTCNPEVLWMHLTAQHDWLNICSWIEESEPNRAGGGQANWPPLTADIIDRNMLCSSSMRNDILNKLARYMPLGRHTTCLSSVEPRSGSSRSTLTRTNFYIVFSALFWNSTKPLINLILNLYWHFLLSENGKKQESDRNPLLALQSH